MQPRVPLLHVKEDPSRQVCVVGPPGISGPFVQYAGELSMQPRVPLLHVKEDPSGQVCLTEPPRRLGPSLQNVGELSMQPRVPAEQLNSVPFAQLCVSPLPSGCCARCSPRSPNILFLYRANAQTELFARSRCLAKLT